MTARQLIAAFLSILLLAGGPALGAVPEQNGHADMSAADIDGCGGLSHEYSGPGEEAADNCNEPQQSHCRVSAPHCSFTSVVGLVAGSLVTPLKLPGQFAASPVRRAYQNPVPEVLTPPPDLHS